MTSSEPVRSLVLTVGEDPLELEGTHRVALLVGPDDSSTIHPSVIGKPVVLRKGQQTCGAIVDRVENGAHTLVMDKFVRSHLHAATGDQVELAFSELPQAVSIEIVVPPSMNLSSQTNLIRIFLIGKPVGRGQIIPVFSAPLIGEEQVGQVVGTEPDGIVLVTRETDVSVRSGTVQQPGIGYRHIGGLSREIERIREIVELPFRHPEVFQSLGMSPPRGIILYGPPGTGKTLICRALAHEVGATVLAVRGPEIISGWYGGSEQNLRKIFDDGRDRTPAIIVIDEMDSIAPRRDRTQGEVEHRVVATLLTLMDGLVDINGVVVIGTTNTINSIDPALRRPGRFEDEIYVGVPDTIGRKEILEIHTRRMPLASDVVLDRLAEKCHGFVGADLASLCRRAAYCALRRLYGKTVGEEDKLTNLAALNVSAEDFELALTKIKPSGLREVMVQAPCDVGWDRIGGLEKVKQTLIENVVFGIKNRIIFLKAGIRPAQGLLLFGPPGTGKTLLARTVAKESGANLIAVRGPEIYSKWFGESEEKLRLIFSKAREAAPCLVLFDELDAIAGIRGGGGENHLSDSIVNQLLAEMDGVDVNDNVFVVGTTNRLELIDPALLRPGRFDCQIEVPLPDAEARENIFSVHLHDKTCCSGLAIAELAARSEGFSGADIAEVCRLAVMEALRDNNFQSEEITLTMCSFGGAFEQVKKTQEHLRDFGF
jgi:transitional endoplasmic reticulum ATPase